jgi:hypothetical protein
MLMSAQPQRCKLGRTAAGPPNIQAGCGRLSKHAGSLLLPFYSLTIFTAQYYLYSIGMAATYLSRHSSSKQTKAIGTLSTDSAGKQAILQFST